MTKPLCHQDYTIAWICALPLEFAAAESMLDERHPKLPTSRKDENTYILGSICGHNVAILCLPDGVYGTTAATALVTQMRSTFEAIRFGLMVGIGGGAPSKENDIRLGDVVVSKPTRDFGGVIQYDYGKTIQEGQFERTGVLNKPPTILLTALSRLRAAHESGPSRIRNIISEAAANNAHLNPKPGYKYPEEDADILFEAGYEHPENEDTCNNCDRLRLVKRSPRNGFDPVIHYGLIASGNQVMKHGLTRDKLAQKLGVLCFEMEAAGLMDVIPCLVIRGICDYSDSHKQKKWQDYAALTAVAYAKELISVIHADQIVDALPASSRADEVWQYDSVSAIPDLLLPESITKRSIIENRIDDWIIERLSNYDHEKVYRRLCRKRLLGTTQWFIDHPVFREWLTGDAIPSLWCSGKIGSGKTIIATSVIETAKYRSPELRAPTVFYYVENEETSTLSVPFILRSFIKQICEFFRLTSAPFADNSILSDIHKFFGEKRTVPDIEDLEYVFVRLYRCVPDTIYVIDGFDALNQENCRILLRLIKQLFSDVSDRRGSKCMLLSREQIPGFTNVATLIPGIRQISTSSNIMQDIQLYIKTTIDDKTMFRELTNDYNLVDEIKQVLAKESSEMFLVEASSRRLGGDVRRCAKRIVTRDNIAVKVLKWVSFAVRPLHIEELREAVAIAPSDTRWDPERVPQRDYVTGCCANLVVMDPTDGCVRFAHPSVRQFLESDRSCISGYPASAEQGELEFPSPASSMYCKALDFPFIKSASRILNAKPSITLRIPKLAGNQNRSQYRFLNYAIDSWALQTKHITHQSPAWRNFERLATNFNETWNFHPWVSGGRSLLSRLHGLLGWAVKEQHGPLLSIAFRSSKDLLRICNVPLIGETLPALHLASKFGYYTMVKQLLDICDVNSRDLDGYTPLHHAASKGHIDIVRLICNTKKAKVDIPSKSRDTPLWLAANGGYDNIVRYLIKRQANISHLTPEDSLQITPIAAAARNGHAAEVELLLPKGANPSRKNQNGLFPIIAAATNGHVAVVELLLRIGLDPDDRDATGYTPLITALKHGHAAVAELLLEKGAKPDGGNPFEDSPLELASKYGHVAVVELLLEKADFFNDLYQPLVEASKSGHEEIVALLLRRANDAYATLPWFGDGGYPLDILNAIEQLSFQMTAHKSTVLDKQEMLLVAVRKNLKPLANLLLEMGADPNHEHAGYDTPLFEALRIDYGMVKVLLENGADPNKHNNNSCDYPTPLSRAAREGNVEMVKLLLQNGTYPDSRALGAPRPIELARINGHRDIINLLLEHGAFDKSKMR
ncbi:hypothetical protein AJ79_08014 [Helicocarpus griseus UAMH5409]|uniref:Uncharacterized protein n=1 Tax=Helicocarpus griseus UAMH5409 TaxID=1447875 RepID=A0A2B7WX22_9EURO|nr:hypothetical protein AJ79_08014 [Helicocarpus griseus UAMH5409]